MIGGAPFWRPDDRKHPPIVDMAAAVFGIDGPDVVGRRRFDRHVRARALVVWAMRTIPGRPVGYPELGRMLGLHRTSVLDLHQKAILLRLRDRAFADACRALLQKLNLTEEDVHARA